MSSRACAWSRRSTGRNSSKASVRSTRYCAAPAISRRWIFRRAISTGARSRNSRANQAATKWTSPEHAIAAARARNGPGRPKRFRDARRESDPGYYLIAKGRRAFEKELGCRVPLRTRLFRFNSDLGVTSYVGMIAMVTAIILALTLLAVAHRRDRRLGAFCSGDRRSCSGLGCCSRNRKPHDHQTGRREAILPGLELRNGVPPDLRTIIVMPTFCSSGASAIEKQIERLEVHHLSNPDDNFMFALISDWRDCDDGA